MIGTRYAVRLLLADRLDSLRGRSSALLVVLRLTLCGQVGNFRVPPYYHGLITRARSPVHQGWSKPNLCKQTLTETGKARTAELLPPKDGPCRDHACPE